MKRWSLRNTILLVLIAVLCGVVFWGTDLVYNLLTLALIPFGLGPFADNLLLGLWMLAGPLAAELFRVPGTAFLSEAIGATVEILMGSQWGLINFITGLIQGLGTEAGFALTRYRHFGAFGLITSAITGTVFTTGWDWFRSGYAQFQLPLLAGLISVRLVSLLFFSGWLPFKIDQLARRSQLFKSIN